MLHWWLLNTVVQVVNCTRALTRQVVAEISLHSSGRSFLPSAGLCPSRQNVFSPSPSPVSRTGPPSAPSQGGSDAQTMSQKESAKVLKRPQRLLEIDLHPQSVTTPGLAL